MRFTPRQVDILELAAAGLSDKEIARRLTVTHRTVRTHFERLYQAHGIHGRSGAVAAWLIERQAAAQQASEAETGRLRDVVRELELRVDAVLAEAKPAVR